MVIKLNTYSTFLYIMMYVSKILLQKCFIKVLAKDDLCCTLIMLLIRQSLLFLVIVIKDQDNYYWL